MSEFRDTRKIVVFVLFLLLLLLFFVCGPLNFHLWGFLLSGRVWFEYFVICKVRVNANFLRLRPH